LGRARQDVLPEEALVGVDADAPDVLLLGGAQPAETARTSGLELDARALADVVERGLLALRLVGEGRVVCVIDQHLDRLVRLVVVRRVRNEDAAVDTAGGG